LNQVLVLQVNHAVFIMCALIRLKIDYISMKQMSWENIKHGTDTLKGPKLFAIKDYETDVYSLRGGSRKIQDYGYEYFERLD